MRTLKILFIILIYCTQFATAQTFKDGTQIALKTDIDTWVRVCYDCQDMKYSSIDHTLVPYQSAKNAPDAWEVFTVENQDGKIRLKHKGGKYLSNCGACRKDGNNIIAATMTLQSNKKIRSEGLFELIQLDNGKYAIKTSAGTYWARYRPDSGMKSGKNHIISAYLKTYERAAAQFEIKVISKVEGQKTRSMYDQNGKKVLEYSYVNDITTDCSVPDKVKKAFPSETPFYMDLFSSACAEHDYGWSHAPWQKAGFSGTTGKDIADERFLVNMRAACDAKFTSAFDAPRKAACYAAAQTWYIAVKNKVDKDWQDKQTRFTKDATKTVLYSSKW